MPDALPIHSDARNDSAIEAISAALETMAFITPFPPENPLADPSSPVLTRIEFRSAQRSGAIELLCDRQLGNLLAANLLGIMPDDPEAIERAGDALCELANIACGSMLRQGGAAAPGADAAGFVDMSLPRQDSIGPEGWNAFLNDGATLLDAEGLPLAIRYREAA